MQNAHFRLTFIFDAGRQAASSSGSSDAPLSDNALIVTVSPKR
jgi:hypothetical protein